MIPLLVLVAALVACPWLPPWLRFVVVVGPLYLAIKVDLLRRLPGSGRPRGGALLLYVAGWPGMSVAPFVHRDRAAGRRDEAAGRWAYQGAAVLAVGAGCWWLLTVAAGRLGPTAVGWLGVVVVLTTVHLGACDLWTAALRRAGFPVRRLFRDPLASRTLGEFWSKRWNLAFVEMNQVYVLPRLAGRRASSASRVAPLVAAFAVSGVLHEVAISVPVAAGFGGPMLYFLLHGALVAAEDRLGVTRWPSLLTRAWTWAAVLLPLPLLFHDAFRAALVAPIFDGSLR